MALVNGGWTTTNRVLAKFCCVHLKGSLRRGGSKNAHRQMGIASGARDMLPNPALNADVPHAGLRPGSGPPVSLVR